MTKIHVAGLLAFLLFRTPSRSVAVIIPVENSGKEVIVSEKTIPV